MYVLNRDWSCSSHQCFQCGTDLIISVPHLLDYLKMPYIVLTGYALHFVVHTVLAVPKLFLDVISIFCILQSVYASINKNFFLSFFLFYSK